MLKKKSKREETEERWGVSLSSWFLSYSNFLIRKTFAAVLMNNKLFQAEQTTQKQSTHTHIHTHIDTRTHTRRVSPGHQPICLLRESCFPLALLKNRVGKNASHTHTSEYADMTSYLSVPSLCKERGQASAGSLCVSVWLLHCEHRLRNQ